MGRKYIIRLAAGVFICVFGFVGCGQEKSKIKENDFKNAETANMVSQERERSVEEFYTWDLDEIFETRDEFYNEVDSVRKQIDEVAKFEGTVKTIDDLVEILEIQEAIFGELDKISSYVVATKFSDMLDTEATSMMGIVEELGAGYMRTFRFVDREVQKFSEEQINQILKDERLSKYWSYYDDFLVKENSDIACDDLSDIVQQVSGLNWFSENIQQTLFYMDFFPIIYTSPEGKEEIVTEEQFRELENDSDEAIRDAAWKSRQRAIRKFNPIFVMNLESQIKNKLILARAANKKDIRTYELAKEKLPNEVLDVLFESSKKHIGLHRRYYELKAKWMGKESIKSWKRLEPADPNMQKTYSYDEATELILNGLKPLGKETLEVIRKAINERWIDVYPRENKYGNSFVIKSISRHPLIILNFRDTYRDVKNLSALLGTAASEYYMGREQNVYQMLTENMTRRIPELTNYFLLNDYMLENAKTDEEKLYFINEELKGINSAFFETMLVLEFNQTLYKWAEKGEPFSEERLNKEWAKQQSKYFGRAVEFDEFVWEKWRENTGVFADFQSYNTAVASGVGRVVSKKLKEENAEEVSRYREFLAAGTKNDPITTINQLGVNVLDTAYIEELMAEYERLLDEMEELIVAKDN
jgi:oligoendopeptidase F